MTAMPKRAHDDDKEARRAIKRERLDAKRAQKAEAKRDRINATLRLSTAQSEKPKPARPDERTTAKKPRLLSTMLVREKGVRVLDLRVGRGDAVTATSNVRIEYVGRLDNERGAVFDEGVITCALARSSRRSVIEGWTIGLSGARVGGKRRLIIPPVAGYGMEAQGKAIPAGSTLCFDVKVLPGCGLRAANSAGDAAAAVGDDDSEPCPDLVPIPEPGVRFALPSG